MGESVQHLVYDPDREQQKRESSTNFKNILRSALGQGLALGFGDEVEAFVKSIGSDKNYDELVSEIRADIDQFRVDNPALAYSTEIGGALLPSIAAGFVSGGAGTAAGLGTTAARIAGAGSRLAKIKDVARYAAPQVGLGAAYGAGMSEGGIKERAKGAALGGAISGVAAPVARAVLPKISQAAQSLMKQGVKLTPGQATQGTLVGGALKQAEQAASSFPIVGTAPALQRSTDTFNRAVINKALDKIGKAVPTTGKTNLNDLSTYLNTEVKKALDKSILKLKIKDTTALKAHIDNALNTSNFDPSQIKAVQRRLNQFVYQKSSVPSAVNRATRKEIDVLIKQRDRIKGTYPYGLSQAEKAERAAIQDGINALKTSRGSISGKSLQRADSDFRKLIHNYSTSSDAKQRELANVFRTAYKSFDKTLQRDNSKNALTAYNSAKSAYGDFLVISKAGTSSAAQGSTFTPAQLLRASKAADKTSGKAKTYRGEGKLQDIGRLGQDVIGSTLADSGTTPRAIISAGMLGGGAIVDPTSALISGGVLGAYQNPATQQLLLRLLQSSGALGRASINPWAGRFGAELAQ